MDHQIKTLLKPLSSLKTIDNKNICNPYLLFDHLYSQDCYRTKGLWCFLEDTSHADIMLAELEHTSFNKMTTFCAGRTPIYVYPSFYRALKLKFPWNVGGISRDDRCSTRDSLHLHCKTPEASLRTLFNLDLTTNPL